MKKCLFTISFALLFGACFAQQIKWADQVIAVSSELTSIQYSAMQALGKPNVLPVGGESPNAWAPEGFKRREFIKVGFSKPIHIRQVAIAESFAPSALYQVIAYDSVGKEHIISTQNPGAIPVRGRMLNLFVERTTFKVHAIKLEFDGAAVDGKFGIDAIGISDLAYPIVAEVTKMNMLSNGLLVEALDAKINSEYHEYNPIVSADGKTLYFSRKEHPDNIGGVEDKEDIWYSVMDSVDHWQMAQNLKTLNNKGPNFISSLHAATPDGQGAILVLGNKYLDNGKMMSGVSISRMIDGQWSKPEALNIENDYNLHSQANYFLSNTQAVLVMSVERDDTHGDRDLYVSFARGNNLWSEPLNLGPIINTASEESSPFLSEDGKTLYFSSPGFSGYGGSDIYVSHRLDESWLKWSEPENMGPEINSPLEDLFFNIPSHSEYAYYSKGVSEKNTDIFRIKLPLDKKPVQYVKMKGNVVKKGTTEPVETTIVYTRLKDGQSDSVVTVKGAYELTLQKGEEYTVVAIAKGMLTESQYVNLTGKSERTIIPNIEVTEIKPKASIVLNNLFFEVNKADIRDESIVELKRMFTILTENPNVVVAIEGHTDNTGTEAYNMSLSMRRAEAVKKFLESVGIESNRIKVSFFGEGKPKVSNSTEEGRAKNRRVEFKIVSI